MACQRWESAAVAGPGAGVRQVIYYLVLEEIGMRQFNFSMLALAVFAFSAGWYGCGTAPEPAESSSSGPAGEEQHEHGDHEHGDHEHGDADHEHGAEKTDMEKMKEGLAGLSDEDRAAAEKQHTCPVTGDMLGVMGAPTKVRVKDQDVWICCEDCKDELLEKPDEFLAKLKG